VTYSTNIIRKSSKLEDKKSKDFSFQFYCRENFFLKFFNFLFIFHSIIILLLIGLPTVKSEMSGGFKLIYFLLYFLFLYFNHFLN